ncbi:uncharacterized protein LOC122859826 [Aphidius gifuensis]|nr:uncharacterized protein LOC122859826 [Aphidius gifuensis]
MTSYNYDTNVVKHENKLVQNIKCEKNCFGTVEKWCKINQTPKNNATINTIILNEISLLKIKYPFLSDEQIRGKALVKYGIPCFMGDVVRQGPNKIVSKLFQDLRLNPVHQPRVPPAFIMNRKSQINLKKKIKKIKKIDSSSASLLSSQKLSQIFSLQNDNKILNDTNKENIKSTVHLTPRKRMRYPFKKNLFNIFSSLDDDPTCDVDEISSPSKRRKLKAKKVEDLSDDEYSCIFTPRQKKNQQITIIDKENLTPKKSKNIKPTTLSQLPDDIRDEILFDPFERKNKIARNLNDSMNSTSSKIDFFGKNESFASLSNSQKSQETPTLNYDEFSFDEVEQKLLDSPIFNLKNSYSSVFEVDEDIKWNDDYKSQTVDNNSTLEERSVYSNWQPTQQTQTSTHSSTVSYGNSSVTSTDNPWKNVTSQDFSDYERVNPWSQDTVKIFSQELEEINSEDGEWNDSQKTIINDQLIKVNEDSNDTVISKKLLKLNFKMSDIQQNGTFVCCFMNDCRLYNGNIKSPNELAKSLTLGVDEPFVKNLIDKIIKSLMQDDD